jgi:hypothetical protein
MVAFFFSRSKQMLKVNVGLSRKLSRDYSSTGFSLNLEGEICVGLDDPEAMVEKVKEFYDLAEEALNQQIARYESESAIASRDEQRPARTIGQPTAAPEKEPANNGSPKTDDGNGQRNQSGNGQATNGDVATNKQVQYLLNLGKRQGLTPLQLEGRVESILGKKAGVYDLTKREAGDLIDALSQNGTPATNGNGRNRISR